MIPWQFFTSTYAQAVDCPSRSVHWVRTGQQIGTGATILTSTQCTAPCTCMCSWARVLVKNYKRIRGPNSMISQELCLLASKFHFRKGRRQGLQPVHNTTPVEACGSPRVLRGAKLQDILDHKVAKLVARQICGGHHNFI